jgi:exopolysaccharide biosynthesis polyprenyl glycosylphosphotransferase
VSPELRDTVEALPLPAAASVPRVGRRTAAYLATTGRYGAVWLPAYALLTSRTPSLSQTVVLATAIAWVWFLALHKAFGAARLTLLSLGPGVASAMGSATGFVGVSALGVWVPLNLSPGVLAEMTGAVFVLSWAWEGLVHRSLAGRRRVLVIGETDGGSELASELRTADDTPFDLVALVEDDRLDDIGALVERERPDIVVLAGIDQRPDAFERLLDVATAGFKVVGLPEFYEHAFGRVPVQTLKPSWFMNVLHLYQRPYTRAAKRGFDVAVALVGLLVTGWLFPILWLVVRRTGGPGPVIFRQTRLGEGGRHFTIYKFRSMRLDAETTGAVWASQDDPRITKSGKFMRKTRLDELPQLVNVLKGDMSIVGPRPERPEFLEQLRDAVPFWTRRHLVKPGITGWAQVRRGYTADAEGTADKLSYDLWYLRHRSIVIDFAVCVKTFTTVFTGAGAR